MVLPTVPGAVLHTLKQKTEKEKKSLIGNGNNNEEEVLFCEPPRGIKILLTTDYVMCIL